MRDRVSGRFASEFGNVGGSVKAYPLPIQRLAEIAPAVEVEAPRMPRPLGEVLVAVDALGAEIARGFDLYYDWVLPRRLALVG